MKNQGFTLFIAIIVMGTLLLVTTGLISLAVRQSLISASGRESQQAFYAADTGMECALYWDVKNPSGISAFSTTTGSTISCNNSSGQAVGGSSQSTFSLNLTPDSSCTSVTVRKSYQGSTLVTSIESKGYNTCDLSNPRRVERAVRAVY
jgi:Tfp pilus assembly protein PilX